MDLVKSVMIKNALLLFIVLMAFLMYGEGYILENL